MAVPSGQIQRATFADGSVVKYITGNGDFPYTIKGVQVSDQLNDFNIRAYPQQNTGGVIYAFARFTVTGVMFNQNADCSGFDNEESPPYLSVPKSGSNTVKAKVVPDQATGNFTFQAQSGSGISVSPTSITSGEQTLTITGGATTGNFTVQAFANQATNPAATLNTAIRRRIDKTVVIHAVNEDNDDVQAMSVGVGSKNSASNSRGS